MAMPNGRRISPPLPKLSASGNAPWIAAKIVGLVVYIALGMVALRLGRTRAIRAGAWVAALITFGYIVTVALTKDPHGALAWIG